MMKTNSPLPPAHNSYDLCTYNYQSTVQIRLGKKPAGQSGINMQKAYVQVVERGSKGFPLMPYLNARCIKHCYVEPGCASSPH